MRARRHVTSGGPLLKSAAWRGFLRDMGLILATFIIGYGISVFWLTPGSMFSKNHSLPRVLEMPESKARQKLTDLGFRPRIEGERPSDAFPAGTVRCRVCAPWLAHRRVFAGKSTRFAFGTLRIAQRTR